MEKIDMKKLFEAFQQLIKELKSIKDDMKAELSQLSDNVLAKIKNLQAQLDGMQHYGEDFAKFKAEVRRDIDTLRSELEDKIRDLKTGYFEGIADSKKTIENMGENLTNKEYHKSPEKTPRKESEDLSKKKPMEPVESPK